MIDEIATAVRAVAPLGSFLLAGIAVIVASKSLRRTNKSFTYTVSKDARSRLEGTLFELITSVADLELAVRAWSEEKATRKPSEVRNAWRDFVLAHSNIDVLAKQARPQDELVLFAAWNICASASAEERYPEDGYGDKSGPPAATFAHAEAIDREVQELSRSLDEIVRAKYPSIETWWTAKEKQIPGWFGADVSYRAHFCLMVSQYRTDYLVPWVADFSDYHMQLTIQEMQ